MHDDLLGIEGPQGCIVFPVLYGLAIRAKTKQQSSKPLKPMQLRSIRKIPSSNVVNLTYRRHLHEVIERSAKGPRRPDPATIKTDPDFWEKYKEWWDQYD